MYPRDEKGDKMGKIELYHFHKNTKFNEMWQEGKMILVPDNFKNNLYHKVNNFTTAIPVNNGELVNYFQVAEQYLLNGFVDPGTMMQLLAHSYRISYNALIFKREQALENYRLQHCKHLPSRLHSVYLTDEKGIDTWIDKLGTDDLSLFRVEAEGNIFKTNEQLIPEEELTYEKFLEQAYRYWNPNFKRVPDNTNEYLAQGKILVKEKIKI